jgi:DNA polymerase-3 subunit gamma/tau
MAKNKTTTETPAAPDTAAEGYTVLARRYRPQTFSEVVGQEPVARALVNALKSNRVAHAYLFTGARGVGKTSTARILAKALNCEKGPTPTPCGVCPMCQGIASGEDVDVLEIDGASNNGVDNIRELRGNTQYLPQRARFKIYIIDEVHMLSKGAFNALLKTLEEPPPHVKFIFATTEVDKIPITILSRCQRFDFAGISLPRIVERLRTIVEREGMQADDEALELVARRAGGSMRDAESLLDQLLAFGSDRLTADQVHHLLGTAGDERILALAEALVSRESKQALDLLDEALVGGLQLGELLDQLLAYWRDLMVVHCAGPTDGKTSRDLSVPARHHDTLGRHARTLTLDSILAGLDVLSTTKARLRGSNHARTLVEMALVRLSRLGDLVSLTQMAQWLAQPQAAPGPRPALSAPPGSAGVSPAQMRVQPPEGVKKKSLSPEPNGNAAPPSANTDDLGAIWTQTLGMVGPLLARSLERAEFPAISGPNTLVIRFPASYNQAREHCQEPASVTQVEQALRKVTGRSWSLRIESGGPAAAAPVEPRVESEATPPRPRRNAREEVEKLPLVKRALDVLGASIQRVDEGFGLAAEDSQGPEQEES